MIEIQKAIYARLRGDAPLVALLGSQDRVRYAFGIESVERSELVFRRLSPAPGAVDADGVKSIDDLWQIDVYGENIAEIEYRVRTLLDGHRFASNSQTGGFSTHFASGLPDDFDEKLKVPMRSVRYRVFAVPVGVAQV